MLCVVLSLNNVAERCLRGLKRYFFIDVAKYICVQVAVAALAKMNHERLTGGMVHLVICYWGIIEKYWNPIRPHCSDIRLVSERLKEWTVKFPGWTHRRRRYSFCDEICKSCWRFKWQGVAGCLGWQRLVHSVQSDLLSSSVPICFSLFSFAFYIFFGEGDSWHVSPLLSSLSFYHFSYSIFIYVFLSFRFFYCSWQISPFLSSLFLSLFIFISVNFYLPFLFRGRFLAYLLFFPLFHFIALSLFFFVFFSFTLQ